MKIIRIFPRQTKATPVDDCVRIGSQPGFFDECDEAHISVAFTWDLPLAERLAKAWRHVAPVKIGGPATGEKSGEFVPGMYLKQGYTITSRGCPNKCWFCPVWQREGGIRELPIRDGWNVQDDNLLACSDEHIKAVFDMLKRQPHPAEFAGGLEARRLKEWHCKALKELKPAQAFFAYDTPDDLEPLQAAGKMLRNAGFSTKSHMLRCYVFCGWPKDTQEQAERRMIEAMDAGFTPMAMAMRDKSGQRTHQWAQFQRRWARPAIVHAKKVQNNA